MQCKDIADEDFLEAVRTASRLSGGGWAMAWDVGCILAGQPQHIGDHAAHHDAPGNECFPWRLLRAKAQKVIDKGLLEGCACGCRGDYWIPGEQPMENRAEVLVAPIGESANVWARTGWKSLGYATEGPDAFDDEQAGDDQEGRRIVIGGTVVRLKAPDMSSLGRALKDFADSMRASLEEFRRMRERTERSKKLSDMRAQYRSRRGRRRFR